MSATQTLTQSVINGINALNRGIGRLVSWLSLLMVLITCSVVLLRYCFNVGWIAMQELTSYMHILLFMLGMAYTLQQDAHVRVDIFYQNFTARQQAWVNLLGTFLLLLPVCLFIVWSSWEYVMDSWEIGESSRNSGGLPGVYLLKTTLLIMPILLALQGLSDSLKNLLLICSNHDTLQQEHG